MAILDNLSAKLDLLAAFEAGPYPVVSLYLDTQPDQNGRDHFEPFLRKELAERMRTYAASGPERESLNQDAARLRGYLDGIEPSVNGIAAFACSGAGLFETVELVAPVPEHRMFISDLPHLYPLARLIDEYPRYAAVVADTSSARIFVFAANVVERAQQIEGARTPRQKMGGWSQARYQRHIENFHLQHAKEIAETLARIVREDRITSVVVSGSEVILPLLREQFSKDIGERVIDVVKLDIRAPQWEVLEKTIAALRQKDSETDREKVETLLGAYRANGLGVVGYDDTKAALELGQVEELIVTATADAIDAGEKHVGDVPPDRSVEERAADELIARARLTAARIRFIEDRSLLEAVGGVGALLRFKV